VDGCIDVGWFCGDDSVLGGPLAGGPELVRLTFRIAEITMSFWLFREHGYLKTRVSKKFSLFEHFFKF
jgi:hypothetical protein